MGGLFGLAFAGSPAKLAEGVRIAGVDVGGMSPDEARLALEQHARSLSGVPVTFTAGRLRWQLRPRQLGVSVDWKRAVAAAEREGGGLGPLRGFRRIEVRVFGADVAPPVRVYRAALDYELSRFAREIDAAPLDAAVRLRGLHPVVVHARAGRKLDRSAAADVVVHALAGLTRSPVALPVQVEAPSMTADELGPAVAQVRRALSAPVRLRVGQTRLRLPRWRIAELLALPGNGRRSVGIGGPAADRWFDRLARQVDHPAFDADFAVYSDGVKVIPGRPGTSLDVAQTRRALLAAALSATDRAAQIAVSTTEPDRTTAEAEAMHVTSLVSSYETAYGGDANRIHNVQLVAHLVDRHVLAPGETFSFNATTGERSAKKGFREAPVIIDGELQTALGGGVCQVSTTVFNAAYEAGLPITARTNHSLYISHYPQGRDATVNYPDTDLKFVNDTAGWLLLRTFVGPSSLVVALFGTPTHRRVETQTAPLVETAPPPVQRVPDPTVQAGQKVVEDSGEPARSTSVRRRVYSAAGKLLSDTTWSSSYRAEPEVLRVGSKRKAKPKPATTTTTTTTTTAKKTPALGRRSVLP